MKWAELSLPALDAWVARAEVAAGRFTFDSEQHSVDLIQLHDAGTVGSVFPASKDQRGLMHGLPFFPRGPSCGNFLPTTDPTFSWPIIEREGFAVGKFFAPIDGPVSGAIQPGHEFCALSHDDTIRATGPSMLVAAMLVYLEQTYGPDVPEVAP